MNRDKSSTQFVPDDLLDYDEELIYTYRGQRFAGVGYSEVQGHGRSEISYVGGLQDGASRDWYPSGVMKYEANYRQNARHGKTREYNADGSLVMEATYEHGVLVRSATFNNSGTEIDSFVISENDPNFEHLQQLRERFD